MKYPKKTTNLIDMGAEVVMKMIKKVKKLKKTNKSKK
jgi:hypothetical protein